MFTLFEAALWAAVLSTGLMAGIYFAFSVFIMSAFKTIPDTSAAIAMNAINKVIVKSAFMPVFFGSSLLAIVLVFLALDGERAGLIMLAGGVYILGMLLCTVLFNVPLNNRLLKASFENQPGVWRNYVIEWTRWNHVRSISSLLAFILYVLALKTV